MKTIAFVNQKGGAGKNTLCQELAVRADREGKKVAIFDHDEQVSITQWGKDRAICALYRFERVKRISTLPV